MHDFARALIFIMCAVDVSVCMCAIVRAYVHIPHINANKVSFERRKNDGTRSVMV